MTKSPNYTGILPNGTICKTCATNHPEGYCHGLFGEYAPKNPPNYRRVECCGNCKHFEDDGLDYSCIRNEYRSDVSTDRICDDYEAEDGEAS